MTDRAYIRLYDTLPNARQADDPKSVGVYQDGGVVVRSDEFYLQTTNISGGIAFGQAFTAHLVDSCDNVLLDITSKVGIFEFLDGNGVPQISFELAYLPNQSGKCHIRFTHTETNIKWWSNPVRCTDSDYIYSTLIAYKGYGYDDNTGLDYSRADFYNIVRVAGCFVIGVSDEQDTKGYNQDRGQKINSRVRIYEMNKYGVEYTSVHGFRALNRILAQDILYIEYNDVLVRSTDKPFIKASDLIGASNLLKSEFSTSPDWSDTFTPELQIIEVLELTEYLPLGTYALSEQPPNEISGVFNKPITLGVGTVNVYDSSNNLIVSFDQSDITVTGNSWSIPFTQVSDEGQYLIVVSGGLFISGSEVFAGASWEFEIIDAGYYDPEYYDDNYYLT